MDTATLSLREGLYAALVEPFRFPTPAAAVRFRSGIWQEEVDHTARQFGDGLAPAELLQLTLDDSSFQTEFIALFEVGVGGAPCPLHSGHYGRDRMINMEEVVRFYDFFGFEPGRSRNHYPDHITAELGFMVHLAGRQRLELERGGDHASPMRAQRDFVARHLTSWLPRLEERVTARAGDPFFRNIIRFANAFTTWDRDCLDAMAR